MTAARATEVENREYRHEPRYHRGDMVIDPCPICGAAPIEDTMLREEPYLTCPTVFTEIGKPDVPCPMHAEGYEAWSTLCRSATKTAKERL
ncbi:hypothetical protein A8B82_04425 [Sulfitobacter sp. EhC04]|nr:hypothetical protein A8B82_04425 [Sulfitobacter sp. EhC04]